MPREYIYAQSAVGLALVYEHITDISLLPGFFTSAITKNTTDCFVQISHISVK